MFNGLCRRRFRSPGCSSMALPARADFAKRFGAFSETNVGVNVGGGVKMSLAGPLRLRFDYRVFTLQGTPLYSHPQRFYAGLNLKF